MRAYLARTACRASRACNLYRVDELPNEGDDEMIPVGPNESGNSYT